MHLGNKRKIDFFFVFRSIFTTFANMERKDYEAYMEKYADEIEKIRQSAYDLHKSVNQTYGDDLLSEKMMCCRYSLAATITTAWRTPE